MGGGRLHFTVQIARQESRTGVVRMPKRCPGRTVVQMPF